MIEYKLAVYSIDPDSYYDREGFTKPRWHQLRDGGFAPSKDDFEKLVFRIDGVIYRKYTTEFQHAWLMAKLKND